MPYGPKTRDQKFRKISRPLFPWCHSKRGEHQLVTVIGSNENKGDHRDDHQQYQVGALPSASTGWHNTNRKVSQAMGTTTMKQIFKTMTEYLCVLIKGDHFKDSHQRPEGYGTHQEGKRSSAQIRGHLYGGEIAMAARQRCRL